MFKLLFVFYRVFNRLQNELSTVLFKSAIGQYGKEIRVNWPFCGLGYKYITIGNNFTAESGLRIEAWDKYAGVPYSPEIIIGDNVSFGYYAHIGAISKMIIGNNVLIGSHVLITDHQHGRLTPETIKIMPRDRPLFSKGNVTIEDNVWIGEGVCILDGTTIGRNSVIGCNSVVTKDVPPNSVVAGVRAEVVRSINA
jgi:acetyltransferase-like isoleucine patch superfamily enzyme